ncbi:MAG: hypothetical protein Q8P67_19105 [archaeon]|nr:hypothetical protein [archaeon]
MKSSSIADLYQQTPLLMRRRLLNSRNFGELRSHLAPLDIDQFAIDLSQHWLKSMIPSGLFGIDESLWRFECLVPDTENNQVIRSIPSKPAKHGLLSYELCGFTRFSNLPYTFAIVPITLQTKFSSGEAALHLIELFNSHSPASSEMKNTCIMDAAYSAQGTLTAIGEKKWRHIVSFNPTFHQDLALVLRSGISPYEHRMIISPDRKTIYTGYLTRFKPTAKQQQKGQVGGHDLLILNATTAFQVSHPRLSTTSPPTVTDSGSSLRASLNPSNPLSIRLPAATVRQAVHLESSVGPGSSTQQEADWPLFSAFINGTDYQEISILGKTYTREQILRMRQTHAQTLLRDLRYPNATTMKKKEALETLWAIKDSANMTLIAETMVPKCPRLLGADEKSRLPMVTIYREHFASIDRLDSFLSQADSSIKYRCWRPRLTNRLLMVAFNNVRTQIVEKQIWQQTRAQNLSETKPFLEALANTLFDLADQTTIASNLKFPDLFGPFSNQST